MTKNETLQLLVRFAGTNPTVEDCVKQAHILGIPRFGLVFQPNGTVNPFIPDEPQAAPPPELPEFEDDPATSGPITTEATA
ncbi:MAG: hypothetical protein JNL32_16475 [Candidatus Kapabacteria bacterium]|nr:hypothetical protein [Candidatus Kapabacteria bacterium]